MSNPGESQNPASGDGPAGKPSDQPLQATPVEVQNALSKLAESKPQKIMELMAMEGSFGGNPLHSKMTESHITQVLEVAAQHDLRQYTLHKESQDNTHKDTISLRRYAFASFCIVSVLILLILVLFRHQPQILVPTLTGIGGFIGGGLGGFGLSRSTKS